MPICITCSTPVKNLYTTYSKADDRSLGKGVRLTQCPNCKRFADKYVEHDYVVLFIDLVLIKPQVYRHLLFNRLGRTDDKLDPSILRLGILLILFDVYITWARIETSNKTTQEAGSTIKTTPGNLSNAPIITQYLFFLTLNVAATVAQHVTIRVLARVLEKVQPSQYFNKQEIDLNTGSPSVSSRGSPAKHHVSSTSPNADGSSVPAGPKSQLHNDARKSSATVPSYPSPGHASPAAISTALLVSSCTKLFPILLVIWPTSSSAPTSDGTVLTSTSFTHRASSYLSYVVLLNNIEALLVLLDCGYVVATVLAVGGVMARWVVEGWLLGSVGLVREVGLFGDLMKAVGRWWG